MRLEAIARKRALDRDTIEIWFADEARIGQKNKITRRWAKRGTRPSAPRDQRTASTYIFGAVCPKEGKGAALIMPACNTEAMNLHLAEIAATVAPAAHAILLVDQAGWHLSTRLLVPANITIIVLPPKCPELNPVENVKAEAGGTATLFVKSGDDYVRVSTNVPDSVHGLALGTILDPKGKAIMNIIKTEAIYSKVEIVIKIDVSGYNVTKAASSKR